MGLETEHPIKHRAIPLTEDHDRELKRIQEKAKREKRNDNYTPLPGAVEIYRDNLKRRH